MNKIIVYKTFSNPIEANIVKGRLEDNGINCYLGDEHTLTLNPLYTQALGGIKLHILEEDLEKAESLLSEDVQLPVEDIPESTRTCPSCHSTNVGFGGATKKRFGLLTMAVSLLLMIYPFKVNKAWHCYKCGCEFK